ncbi:hypothetical protein HK096_010379, partial [Nowakowskiella sp. JEL0078]
MNERTVPTKQFQSDLMFSLQNFEILKENSPETAILSIFSTAGQQVAEKNIIRGLFFRRDVRAVGRPSISPANHGEHHKVFGGDSFNGASQTLKVQICQQWLGNGKLKRGKEMLTNSAIQQFPCATMQNKPYFNDKLKAKLAFPDYWKTQYKNWSLLDIGPFILEKKNWDFQQIARVIRKDLNILSSDPSIPSVVRDKAKKLAANFEKDSQELKEFITSKEINAAHKHNAKRQRLMIQGMSATLQLLTQKAVEAVEKEAEVEETRDVENKQQKFIVNQDVCACPSKQEPPKEDEDETEVYSSDEDEIIGFGTTSTCGGDGNNMIATKIEKSIESFMLEKSVQGIKDLNGEWRYAL